MSSVRHQINIAASSRTVWNALTTAEGVSSWWSDEARVDARDGGRMVLVHLGGNEDGSDLHERAVFHTVKPTRLIEIAFDTGNNGPTPGARLKFQLGRDGDETRVHVVHTCAAFDEDEALRAEVERGWKGAFKALQSALE